MRFAATFEAYTEYLKPKARKQSSLDGTEPKHVSKSLRAEEMRSLGNDNFEGEGDLKTEEEEAASEDRRPCTSPADSKKRKRKFSGDKVLKVIL